MKSFASELAARQQLDRSPLRVVRTEVTIVQYPHLRIVFFGTSEDSASAAPPFLLLREDMPTSRATLPSDEQAAVEEAVRERFPEHPRLLERLTA